MKLDVPKELRGWLMMTVFTPIVNMIINSNNIIDGFKKLFCYFHTWDSKATREVVSWLDHYLKANIVWSQETVTEVAKSKRVFWWNSGEVANRSQTREIPTGWCALKYKGGYLFVHSPFPSTTTQYNNTKVDKSITIYSLNKIDWGQFVAHVRDFYYEDVAASRMMLYTSCPRWCYWEDSCLDVRPDVDRSYCFGNPAKEACWDAVLQFFNPETKRRYKRLGQIYKTSFLIHGPPGTGKSELIYLIAAYMWKTVQIPIYLLNPRGMSDETLQVMLNGISSGIVVVNEFDMGVKLPRKRWKKKSDAEGTDGKDEDEDKEEDEDRAFETYPSVTGWHQVMDSTPGEVVFWFTTNNYDRLKKINHGSLVRKGRIDHTFKFDKITDDEIKRIVAKFSPDTDLDKIPKGLTIADVIANIKFHGRFVSDTLETSETVEVAALEA